MPILRLLLGTRKMDLRDGDIFFQRSWSIFSAAMQLVLMESCWKISSASLTINDTVSASSAMWLAFNFCKERRFLLGEFIFIYFVQKLSQGQNLFGNHFFVFSFQFGNEGFLLGKFHVKNSFELSHRQCTFGSFGRGRFPYGSNFILMSSLQCTYIYTSRASPFCSCLFMILNKFLWCFLLATFHCTPLMHERIWASNDTPHAKLSSLVRPSAIMFFHRSPPQEFQGITRKRYDTWFSQDTLSFHQNPKLIFYKIAVNQL